MKRVTERYKIFPAEFIGKKEVFGLWIFCALFRDAVQLLSRHFSSSALPEASIAVPRTPRNTENCNFLPEAYVP